ncbi:MAG: histidine kinase [Myxococcales bacterium]|nr:histidine kinase [Myxococcales bacterium]
MSLRARDRATRDALIAALLVVGGGLVFTHLDVAEALSSAVARGEDFEVDDVLLTLALAVVCTGWLAVRRYHDARRQTSALQASERERLRSIERLGALSAKLMSAEADERERIAVVVHDAVSQPLYAARLRLDSLLERGPSDSQRKLLHEARELVEAAMEQGRDLTAELSPPGLSDLPMDDALSELAAQLSARYGVSMQVEPDGPWSDIEPARKGAVYEAVRELLSNAGKHAQARTVTVSAVHSGAGETRVRVCDDGTGFELAVAEGSGFGLLSIEQRLRRVGIGLSIRSTVDEGTTAELRIAH